MIDFKKLRHEWKTFFLAIVATLVGTWEAARDSGYDLTPIVPEKYRAYVVPGVGLAFLLLRQYRDATSVKTTTETITTETKTDV